MDKSLLIWTISKSVLIILTICEEFIFGRSSVKSPPPLLKIGKFKDYSKMVISSQEKKSKNICSSFDCNWFISRSKSRKFQNRVGNPRITPKRIRKILPFKISREFQILIQLSTQIFEQMAQNFKKIGLFMKILVKLYHILVLSMVHDFGRIFEIFVTENSKLGFHVTHFSNKIPSY